MEPKLLGEIERFLAGVRKPSLYLYLQISPEDPPEAADAALRRRRSWAQGQQTSPAHRDEALFLIRNYGLLHRVLVEDADAWRLHVHDSLIARAIDGLAEEARARVTNSELSPEAETEILDRARALDLDLGVVRWRIDDALQDMGARRRSAAERPSDPVAMLPVDDHYAVLGVDPDADIDALVAGFDRQARIVARMSDPVEAAERRHALELAWETLSDPERRRTYDRSRDVLAASTEEGLRRAWMASHLREQAATDAQHDDPPSELPAGPGRWTPQLVVRTTTLSVRAGDTPLRAVFVVRNEGRGRMPGWVRADEPWIRVLRQRLDPSAVSQEVTVEINPLALRWGSTTGRVVVDADHGEQATLSVRVFRVPWRRIAVVGGYGGGVAALAASIGWFGWGYLASHEPGRVTFEVTPETAAVDVDGRLFGEGGAVEVVQPRLDTRFEVRITASGYVPHRELVELNRGQVAHRTVVLTPLTGNADAAAPAEAAPAVAAPTEGAPDAGSTSSAPAHVDHAKPAGHGTHE